MNEVEAVIFDCDGVMFASQRANLAYYNRILAEFSYPAVQEEEREKAHFCHTASSPQVLEKLLRPEDFPAALKFAADLDYRQFIPYMQPEENLGDLLEQLHGRYPLAIATNRGRSIVPILEHFRFRDFFDVIVTSQDVARPKPAPDMLLLAAEKLNKQPFRCLFVGDSELDRTAAVEANVRFAGYGSMVSGTPALTNHLQLLNVLGVQPG